MPAFLGISILCWVSYSISAFSLILALDSYFKARKARKETDELCQIVNAFLEQEKKNG